MKVLSTSQTLDEPHNGIIKAHTMSNKKTASNDTLPHMPSADLVAQELGKAKSIDDFFGKKGIFSKLFHCFV